MTLLKGVIFEKAEIEWWLPEAGERGVVELDLNITACIHASNLTGHPPTCPTFMFLCIH
jgi:hypothetical protein